MQSLFFVRRDTTRKLFQSIVTSLLVFILLLSSSSCAKASIAPALINSSTPSLAPILEKVLPAVVNISTSKVVGVEYEDLYFDPFWRGFYGVNPREKRSQGIGSGVIIDKNNGYILTNNHVIKKADDIYVTLKSGEKLEAELVGADASTDIAVLKINTDTPLTQIPVADSDQLRVGDFAVSIGNPFGLSHSVSSGIVSALGRKGLGIEGYEDFIQTDASINPGSSGGALINLRGELIGINTAILSRSGGNIGIAFAIPVNIAEQVKDQILKYGSVKRGAIGIKIVDLKSEIAKKLNSDLKQGALVAKILKNGPAYQAGLRPGDIIIAIDDKKVTNALDLRNIIGLKAVGDKLLVKYSRDGKIRSCNIEVK
ncbi:MAG: trypsin-like peptidase domain-containing protein [Candidatus Caenarcaniphilales bacterium]|nr:trypsin-like peptidase domain-containing protein [Candidatus Caenarcaniphilales bacterium]